ncbi:uncharacterized protein JN550_005878 [Neoarthrinium moseri]|uniref:uncharacterized protein n=1 Tax=Neoarthrinium moseri TaxID=1658444 RepID=UPI001FDD7CEA|nr:uncharacterized protein JN550_005878 [Neoarthrinium moseri]KAI1869248.1 hypothetical protein JN550_005878 [Neoarthrinium moseri]
MLGSLRRLGIEPRMDWLVFHVSYALPDQTPGHDETKPTLKYINTCPTRAVVTSGHVDQLSIYSILPVACTTMRVVCYQHLQSTSVFPNSRPRARYQDIADCVLRAQGSALMFRST